MSNVEQQGRFLSRRVSRRAFLRGSLNSASALFVVGAGLSLIASQECDADDLTDEQKKALRLFETADKSNFVHNVVVVGEEVNGQKIAYLRNKPKTERDKDDLSAGRKDGKLKAGEIINQALVVLGNSRQIPMDSRLQEKWLGIKIGGKVLFAYSDLFEPSQELTMSQPIDLSK